MGLLGAVALVVGVLAPAGAKAALPHLVHVIIDVLGWQQVAVTHAAYRPARHTRMHS